MTRITPSLPVTALLMLGLAAAPARASCNPPFCTPTFSHTYVSAAGGSDANNCGLGAPCRNFQRAHDQTNDQGVITVLDPGDFGLLTITKSINIMNDGGGEATILVKGGATGITINGGAGAYVNLRGLTIQGVGAGIGLVFNTGFSLTMENCVVRNLTGDGIDFAPSGNSNLALSNMLIADNGGSGILVQPTGTGSGKAVLNNVAAYNNSRDGISVDGSGGTGTITATAVDSVVANNGGSGFAAHTLSGKKSVNLMVVRSMAAGNSDGLIAGGAPATTIRVAQSEITGNTICWQVVAGGVLQSYGDNDINGNNDGDPAPPTIGRK